MRSHLKVRHYEADGYGHVNHASYVHYLETARIEALDAVGLSLGEMRRHGILAVAAELSVKYHSPAGPDETLEIGVRCEWIGTKSFALTYEIREQATKRLVADATSILVCYDYERQRSIPVPDSLRRRMEAFEGRSLARKAAEK